MGPCFTDSVPVFCRDLYRLTAVWLPSCHAYGVGPRSVGRSPVIMMTFSRLLLVVLLSAAVPLFAPAVQAAPAESSLVASGPEAAYRVLAEVAALAVDLDPLMVQALIEVESAWRPDAVSVDGAVGLMQILPITGGDYLSAPDLADPVTNLRIGVTHLAGLVRRFGVVRALGAWNAGPGAVVRSPVFSRYRETRRFVARVLLEWESLRRAAGVRLDVPAGWTGGVFRMPDLLPSGGAW